MDKVPSWDEYFVTVAKAVARRSKDPCTKVGSLLVDAQHHIVGTGYNGFNPGAVETPELWERPVKYEHVRHAERNAIEFSTTLVLYPFRDYTLYTTLYPCYACALLIADKQIRRIVYCDHKYWTPEADELFEYCGIEVLKFKKEAK